MMELKRAIFFDRDNTLNVQRRYSLGDPEYGTPAASVCTWEDFRFLPGVLEGLKLLSDTEYLLIVISNQSCIGRGLVEWRLINNIFVKMKQAIDEYVYGDKLVVVRNGEKLAVDLNLLPIIAKSYFCPHVPEDNCSCRKPKPGMIYHAAIMHELDLSRSWMIGDSESDMKAAENAGICNRILITNNLVDGLRLDPCPGVAPNLLEAARLIIREQKCIE